MTVRYKKSRFSTRLPSDRSYTAGHYWIKSHGDGLCRVGLTKFATRMLGELVEMGFSVNESQQITLGDTIGWVESLKAASDVYSVVEGIFSGQNSELENNPDLLHEDPYGEGWLYEAEGTPDPDAVGVHGYTCILDAIIDQMLGENKDE